MDLILRLANQSQASLDLAATQTGAGPDELREAACLLTQRLCFARGASHYRVLGVEPDAPTGEIKRHYHLLMRLYHPDRTVGREVWTQPFASRINEAWTVLGNAQSRASYDARSARHREPPPVWGPTVERAAARPPPGAAWAAHVRRRPIPPRYPATRRGPRGIAFLLGTIGLGLTAVLLWVEEPNLNAVRPLAARIGAHFHPPHATVAPGQPPDPTLSPEELDRISLFPTNLNRDRGPREPPGPAPQTAGGYPAGNLTPLTELQLLVNQAENDLMRLERELKREETRASQPGQVERLRSEVERVERLRNARVMDLRQVGMQGPQTPEAGGQQSGR